MRTSEVVLPGHVDKVCDAIADAVVDAVLAKDRRGRAQVEVSICHHGILVTGSVVARGCADLDVAGIARGTMAGIGYCAPNPCDASRLPVVDWVRKTPVQDPEEYPLVADQCVATGSAGYDRLTGWLPPEHFLARRFVMDLVDAFAPGGQLAGHGPDGKVVVGISESGDEWRLCSLLVSVVQLPGVSYLELLANLAAVLEASWAAVCRRDRRWTGLWQRVDVRLNPSGGWTEGGSLCDNGQTGRKTVMDHYGPRIPVGGGALSGKDPWQVDRVAQSLVRRAALNAVGTGARECQVTVAYGPGSSAPLTLAWAMDGEGGKVPDCHWDLAHHSPRDLLAPCVPIDGSRRRG